LQEGVAQSGVMIELLELKQVGIPTSMQRSLASEAVANVQSKAKFILGNAEGEASQRLVEAGDDLRPVSIHLRYLQTMLKIHRPVEEDMMYVVTLPMEIIQRITGNSGIINILQKIEENNRSGKTENVHRKRRRKVKKNTN
jgi:erythrocyte band 7 integral membrane protein